MAALPPPGGSIRLLPSGRADLVRFSSTSPLELVVIPADLERWTGALDLLEIVRFYTKTFFYLFCNFFYMKTLDSYKKRWFSSTSPLELVVIPADLERWTGALDLHEECVGIAVVVSQTDTAYALARKVKRVGMVTSSSFEKMWHLLSERLRLSA